MKVSATNLAAWFFLLGGLQAGITADSKLLPIALTGTALKLSSVTYYEPPNDQQVQTRMTGDEMTPLPGALYNVKNMIIEGYGKSGKLEYVIKAPQCTLAQLDGVASSPGHLEIELGNGTVRVEGDGFLWVENNQSLDISNHVHTVVKNSPTALKQLKSINEIKQ